MGQDASRQTAFFDAAGRSVEMYRMTEGQQIAIAAVNQRDISQVMSRLWQVLESLFVNPADFERFDHALVIGKITKEAVEKFAQDVLKHTWPDPEPEPTPLTVAQATTDQAGRPLTTDMFGKPVAPDTGNEPY